MRTRLLKKLRRKFDQSYKIVFVDGHYRLVEYNGYLERWAKWPGQTEKYNLEKAKDELHRIWWRYALARVEEIRIQKQELNYE